MAATVYAARSGPGWVDAALAGRHGAGALRDTAQDPLRSGLAELPEARVLAGGGRSTFHLVRSKYKPFRKLSAWYVTPTHHLAVTWTPEAVRAMVCPDDPAMPQLRRLLRSAHLRDVVEDLTGRPARIHDGAQVTVVRYRPGQRHVLVARLVSGSKVCVKTDRRDSGARAVPVATLIGQVLAEGCPDASVVEPVGYIRNDSASLWWGAPGDRLSHSLTNRTPEGVRAAAQAGRALRILHDSPYLSRVEPALSGIGALDVSTEAAATLRSGEHLMTLLPSAGRRYGALVSELRGRLEDLQAEPAAFCHGDFKGDNLLVHQENLRILDLDRACWAEPAVDLGKFLADLRWWRAPGRGADQVAEAFRTGYGDFDRARWTRAELFGVLFHLRHAARRCQVHATDWEHQVRTRLGQADTMLDRAGRS